MTGDRAALVDELADTGGMDRQCVIGVLADVSEDEFDELEGYYHDEPSDGLSSGAQSATEELAGCAGGSSGGTPAGPPSDDEVFAAVMDSVGAYRPTGEIDEDCVRDYVANHGNWPDFSSLAGDAQLNAIATDLALAVNERCSGPSVRGG